MESDNLNKEGSTQPASKKSEANRQQSSSSDTDKEMSPLIGSLSPEDDDKEDSTSDIQTVVYSIPVDHMDTSVYLKGWIVKGSEKPPIIIVHDLGENIGLYRKAAHLLCGYGYSVYGFDLRGHGRSGNMLGHIPKFESLLSDLMQVVAWVRYKSDRKAPFILGQGIGSLITVYFQKVFPTYLQGSLLIAPVINTENYPVFTFRVIIKLLAELSPTLRLPRILTPKFLSHKTHVKKSETGVKVSMLSRYRITANFAKELIIALTGAQSAFLASKNHSLILYPIKSKITNFEAFNKLLLEHPRAGLISCHPLKKSSHNVLSGNQKNLSSYVATIASWLDDKLEEPNKSKENTD